MLYIEPVIKDVIDQLLSFAGLLDLGKNFFIRAKYQVIALLFLLRLSRYSKLHSFVEKPFNVSMLLECYSAVSYEFKLFNLLFI